MIYGLVIFDEKKRGREGQMDMVQLKPISKIFEFR